MTDRARVKEMRSRLPGALLAVVLLILLSLLGNLLWLSYRDQVRSAEAQANNLATIFETRLNDSLQRIDSDLQVLARLISPAALRAENAAINERDINALLVSHLQNGTDLLGYSVYDAGGALLYTSDSLSQSHADVAEQAHFRLLRDASVSGLLFADVPAENAGDGRVLLVARALRAQNGEFLGVIHGLLRLDYYRNQFAGLQLGPHGFVALYRTDNPVPIIRVPNLSSHADRRETVGVVGQASPELRPVADTSVSDDERTSLIVGMRALKEYPFYFRVAYGRADVLAGWRIQCAVVLMSILLILALVGALNRRLGRMRMREAGILDNLARSQTQFNELAQLVPVGIAHFDKWGRYTFANSRYQSLVGRSSEQLLGRKWVEFVHTDDHESLRAAWSRVGTAKTVPDCEYRLIRPNGQVVHVIGEIRHEHDANGKFAGFVVAQTDISQRKRAEAELLVAKQEAESANLAKTKFLAAASHDLRQPIQAINLFHDALVRTELSEEQKTISSFLSKSVRSLGELLYSLLDISKLDAGQVVPQIERTPLDALFRVIDAEFAQIAQQKGLRFKLFYPVDETLLMTDPHLFLSVIRNLIDNAIKYTESGGILIGTRRRHGGLVIQVWDTGIGIDQRFGEQVFDECFQIGNPVRDRSKGIGIGLSIARRTMRLLKGDVRYRSRVGRGTVFEAILPPEGVAFAKSAVFEQNGQWGQAPSELVSTAEISGWKVVVVEDDPVVAKSVELCLGTLGSHVTVYSNAELALADTENMTADLYLSDYNLPGINGVQFLDTVQARTSTKIHGVLMTGETSSERIGAMTGSAWKIVFKPVGLDRLLAVINGVEGGASRAHVA